MEDLAQPDEAICHRDRDSMSMKILGSFFIMLSLLVLLGALWELGDYRAIIVTMICGGSLLLVGIGMVVAGLRIAKGAKPGLDPPGVGRQLDKKEDLPRNNSEQ